MLVYIIKSSISLAFLYGFYFIALRNAKTLNFNRLYLLVSVIFSMAIPLLNLPFGLLRETEMETLINVTKISAQNESFFNQIIIPTFAIILYIIVCPMFAIRFALNINKIINTIRKNKIVDQAETKIVLVDDRILPYSFFSYVFISQTEYEKGEIQRELINHEKAHCKQYHSIDVLIIEFVKIFYWFNPFVWLVGKAIQVNHEYLADRKVLSKSDLHDYQKTLINLVFRNNTIQLISNFNYSLTKKRLKMMEIKTPKNIIYRLLAVIPLVLLLVLFIANCDDKKALDAQNKELQKSIQEQKMTKDLFITKEAQEAIDKGEIAPPPPPPPPPITKKSLKVVKGEEMPAPPPPPPPPVNLGK